MNGEEVIRRDLTTCSLEAASADDVFVAMNERLLGLGYVNESYLANIRKREASYPTALPVEPHAVAIPHTDPVSVERPFVAPVRLSKPVPWGEMADPQHELPVELVFLLGFHDATGHLKLLQNLVRDFQNEAWMERVFSASTDEELYQAVIEMDWED
jgi:PTS system galactitol-specific IIA component